MPRSPSCYPTWRIMPDSLLLVEDEQLPRWRTPPALRARRLGSRLRFEPGRRAPVPVRRPDSTAGSRLGHEPTRRKRPGSAGRSSPRKISAANGSSSRVTAPSRTRCARSASALTIFSKSRAPWRDSISSSPPRPAAPGRSDGSRNSPSPISRPLGSMHLWEPAPRPVKRGNSSADSPRSLSRPS